MSSVRKKNAGVLARTAGGEMETIRDIRMREFGFNWVKGQRWSEETDEIVNITRFERKMGFMSEDELWSYIREHSPDNVYLSVAYWTFPKNACTEGGFWNGADLFFDLDSDNLKHAYADACVIYDVLQDDFGMDDIEMIHSGCKGYHVVAYGWKDNEQRTRRLRELGANERAEIMDYFIGRYRCETIDEAVTRDVNRLRRVPGTKNSKCGKTSKIIKTTN